MASTTSSDLVAASCPNSSSASLTSYYTPLSASIDSDASTPRNRDSVKICHARTTTTITTTGCSNKEDDEEEEDSGFFSTKKPHQAHNTRWRAIQAVQQRDGMLGMDHFLLLKKLGNGNIGNVYLAELRGTGCRFAIKMMDKGELAYRKILHQARMERKILQDLDHPFLPTLYACFDDGWHSCLVMDFCPGGDFDYLLQSQPMKVLPETAARFYVAEILLALEYLHMKGIIYRDLKLENVMLREDGHIVLSDFDASLRCKVSPTIVKASYLDEGYFRKCGYHVRSSSPNSACSRLRCFSLGFLNKRSKKDRSGSRSKQTTVVYNQVMALPELVAEPRSIRSMSFVGTYEYLAPEIIKRIGHGGAVDWWTLGIFLYELLFGKNPFKGHCNSATMFNVVWNPVMFPISSKVSFAARDLITSLLVKDPARRLGYRRGATEIKQHRFFKCVNWALIRSTCPPSVPQQFKIDPHEGGGHPAAAAGEDVSGGEVKASDTFADMDIF